RWWRSCSPSSKAITRRRPRSPPPRRRKAPPPCSSSPPPRGRSWPDRGTAAGKTASRYLVFKFRLTDGRMVAQLPSILEGGEAQATAAEQSSPALVQLQPAPAREELAG